MIPDITADRCRFELDEEGNMIVYGQSPTIVKLDESGPPTYALMYDVHFSVSMTDREFKKFWKRLKQLHNRYHREVRTYKRRKEIIRRMHLKGKWLNLHTDANSVVDAIVKGGTAHEATCTL